MPRILIGLGLRLVLFAAAVELVAFTLLFVTTGQVLSLSAAQNERAALQLEGTAMADRPFEVLHPYLGFVLNPEADSPELRQKHGHPISSFGFIDDGPPLVRRSPDQVVVGIIDASFAYWFSAREGAARLEERLGRDPRFAGKHIRFVRLALGGYKQPQQHMTYSYLLSLGLELDFLIALDGVNEISLPAASNLPSGVDATFPRSWNARVATARTSTIRLLARVTELQEWRVAIARWFSRAPLRWSATATVGWKALDRELSHRITDAQWAFGAARARPDDFEATGPRYAFHDEASLFPELARIWSRSSLQMDRLSRANGIVFFQFLQPNQYVPGSKPMDEDERKRAIHDDQPLKHSIETGYPSLVAAGKELAASGVRFRDLSRIFADVREPLYIDDCCHVGAHGNEILADAIADAILADPWQPQTLSAPPAPDRATGSSARSPSLRPAVPPDS